MLDLLARIYTLPWTTCFGLQLAFIVYIAVIAPIGYVLIEVIWESCRASEESRRFVSVLYLLAAYSPAIAFGFLVLAAFVYGSFNRMSGLTARQLAPGMHLVVGGAMLYLLLKDNFRLSRLRRRRMRIGHDASGSRP